MATTEKALLKTPEMNEENAALQRCIPAATDYPKPIINNIKITEGINAEISWDQDTAHQTSEMFKISWWSNEKDRRSDQTSSRNYMITNLDNGKIYSVNVTRLSTTSRGGSESSDTSHFKTAPHAPYNLRVENYDASPNDSIIVSYDDKNKWEVEYEVRVDDLSGEIDSITKKSNSKLVLINGLKAGHSYSVSVTAFHENEKSKITSWEIVTTNPDAPDCTDLKYEDERLVLKWKRPDMRPSKYLVQWDENAKKCEEEVTDETFYIVDLKPSTTYRIKVASVNGAGTSDFSEEHKYVTAPAAPSKVMVRKNPFSRETSLIVEFEDLDTSQKRYKAVAMSMNGKEVTEASTESHTAVLNDLTPGQPYFVYVVAILGKNTSKKAYCCKTKE